MTVKPFLDPKRTPDSEGVKRAADKIVKILPPTPLLPMSVDGKNIWCKAECLQPIGAFKIRGAWHRLSDLSVRERARGVVAFSSGNHAQGVAWAARRLDVKAIIVMPQDAPKAKMANTLALGAQVVTYDRMTQSRETIAEQIAADTGGIVVPSFDDPWIIEGQGSCGVELREQMINQAGGPPDEMIICCGGGGLAAGITLANSDAKIIVVEPDGWDDMGRSLRGGRIVSVQDNPPPTSCDALQTLRVANMTFDILHRHGAMGVSVSESEIRAAMLAAFERLHVVIEPGGAVALAAVLSGKVEITERTVITLSGGNVDAPKFAEMIT